MRGWSRFIILAATLAAGLAVPGAQPRAAGVQAGLLKCNVASGWGFVVVSWRDMKCVYSPASRPPENYSGKITNSASTSAIRIAR